MSALATQFDLHPNQIKQWKDQPLDGVSDVFDDKPKAPREPEIDVKPLHAKIGQLALQWTYSITDIFTAWRCGALVARD